MNIPEVLKNRIFDHDWMFSATRSSGPGGQNVNKVNTRVELRFNIGLSEGLTNEEKMIIREKLAGKINSNDEIIIVSQSERTQLKNKEKSIEKFYTLLARALFKQKKRFRTHPTQASVLKRLEWKKRNKEKKEGRKPL